MSLYFVCHLASALGPFRVLIVLRILIFLRLDLLFDCVRPSVLMRKEDEERWEIVEVVDEEVIVVVVVLVARAVYARMHVVLIEAA